MSRYLEFIQGIDGEEGERASEQASEQASERFKRADVGCRTAAAAAAAAAAVEKAANKSCPRKRITRESRTPRREKSGKKQCRVLCLGLQPDNTASLRSIKSQSRSRPAGRLLLRESPRLLLYIRLPDRHQRTHIKWH